MFNPGKDAGARVHSCSWGSSANFYTNQDRDFDRYIHDDESFLVVVAAGNSGPNANTVGSPAIAKNVLSGTLTTTPPRLLGCFGFGFFFWGECVPFLLSLYPFFV